ncbi:MAG: phytoene desaturase family protein [Opitutaceae bacterium]
MPDSTNGKSVAVIGAGLGGISAALSLALEGYRVRLFDKNEKIGGKLNFQIQDGYTFDLGPSILTLPAIFEATFAKAGKRMSDYMTICPIRPHWRNFFEDGMVVDLYPEREKMAAEARKAGEDPGAVEAFLEYSGKLYDLVDRGYFREGLDSAKDFRAFYGLSNFGKFDLLRTMHGGVNKRFKTRYFVDIFDFFIKYVGSSAHRAPAFMNCLPTIQFRYDLWYVMGGMYGLAAGLERLLREVGVAIHLGAEVSRIRLTPDGGSACGVELVDGTAFDSDHVVSNMEVIPTYRRLLPADEDFVRPLEKRLEPACSGLVIDVGLDRKYDQLGHHNFFFSGDQKAHFRSVFQKREIPHDPTLYLVAASRTDPAVAPEGCDCLKILPHIPYLDPDRPVAHEDYVALKERIYDKLERMGLTDLRRHIVTEHFWTPRDIEREYYSNRGSIYGVVSDRYRNFAFKAPKVSARYRNLFFVGGSVNPGGGMPMVFLCGQNVARRVVEADQSKP